jgi:hypothetical protein
VEGVGCPEVFHHADLLETIDARSFTTKVLSYDDLGNPATVSQQIGGYAPPIVVTRFYDRLSRLQPW